MNEREDVYTQTWKDYCEQCEAIGVTPVWHKWKGRLPSPTKRNSEFYGHRRYDDLMVQAHNELDSALLEHAANRPLQGRHADTVIVDDLEEPQEEMVNSPTHYKLSDDLDAMDVIKLVLERDFGPDGWKAYCKGNMLKYLLRKKWSPDEDVAKSGRYSEMYKEE